MALFSLQPIGKKDILATLQTGVPNPQSGSDAGHFESVRGPSQAGAGNARHSQSSISPQQQPFGPGPAYNGPSLLLVGAAVLCLCGLLLPTEGEDESTRLPPYLHLSTNIKIVISYVLGKCLLSRLNEDKHGWHQMRVIIKMV